MWSTVKARVLDLVSTIEAPLGGNATRQFAAAKAGQERCDGSAVMTSGYSTLSSRIACGGALLGNLSRTLQLQFANSIHTNPMRSTTTYAKEKLESPKYNPLEGAAWNKQHS